MTTTTAVDTSTHKQRVVILPGPHKTATSSVQGFIVQLQKEGRLGNFVWPGALADKSLATLAGSIVHDKNEELRTRKKERIKRAWQDGYSIVIGAELLDVVAALSKEELHGVFQRFSSLLPQNVTAQVVVMYRTPRTSHLVSAWKQQLAMAEKGNHGTPWRFSLENDGSRPKDKPTLAQWLCTGQWEGQMGFHVETILAAQTNPLGVAHAFHHYGNMTVSVADMSGIDDLPNMVACEILNVPCTDNGKALGTENNEALVLGKRSNPTTLGFGEDEMNVAEQILRRMDCYYYCDVRDHITILHGSDEMFTEKDGWKRCCEMPENFLSPSQAFEKLKEMGCRAVSMTTVDTRTKLKESNNTFANSSVRLEYAMVTFLALVLVYVLFRSRKKRLSKET